MGQGANLRLYDFSDDGGLSCSEVWGMAGGTGGDAAVPGRRFPCVELVDREPSELGVMGL